MKMSTQHVVAMKRTNAMLRIIRKGTENETASTAMLLHKSTVCLRLESFVQFWLAPSQIGQSRAKEGSGTDMRDVHKIMQGMQEAERQIFSLP